MDDIQRIQQELRELTDQKDNLLKRQVELWTIFNLSPELEDEYRQIAGSITDLVTQMLEKESNLKEARLAAYHDTGAKAHRPLAIYACIGAALVAAAGFAAFKTLDSKTPHTAMQQGKGSIRTVAGNPSLLAGVETGDPVPTSTWWSSALQGTLPITLHTIPWSVRFTETGITAGSPTVHANANGFIAPLPSDVSITFPGSTPSTPLVTSHDDLGIRLSLTGSRGEALAQANLVRGVPYQYFNLTAGTVMTLPVAPQASERDGVGIMEFATPAKRYAAYLPSGTFTVTNAVITLTKETSVTLAVFPDGPRTEAVAAALFTNRSPVTSTSSGFSVEGGESETNLTWTTESNSPTLIALLPHQQVPSTEGLTSYGTYQTVRGTAKLVSASSVSIKRPAREAPALPDLPADDGFFSKQNLENYLEAAAKGNLQAGDGTYTGGKELYRLANLLDLAEKAGSPTATTFKASLDKQLADWLTYKPGEPSRFFAYDAALHSLIGTKAEYGSETLNDHHFHYGYFLYAAAVLASYQPDFVADYGTTVDLLAANIANTERSSFEYPYLRHFDAYEGHSWAGGITSFADGNNQESVSEAVNAWYGLALWGKASGNANLQGTGTYLYTEETEAARTYWFGGTEASRFPTGYNRSAVSLIWGGKADYATWFSADPEAKHGILYLPQSAGSGYLVEGGILEKDLASLNQELGSTGAKGWHDVLLMAQALVNPEAARKKFSESVALDNANSLPFLYAWLGWTGQNMITK